MPYALGQRILLHHIFGRGLIFILAAILVVLLIRFWPAIVRWFERRR